MDFNPNEKDIEIINQYIKRIQNKLSYSKERLNKIYKIEQELYYDLVLQFIKDRHIKSLSKKSKNIFIINNKYTLIFTKNNRKIFNKILCLIKDKYCYHCKIDTNYCFLGWQNGDLNFDPNIPPSLLFFHRTNDNLFIEMTKDHSKPISIGGGNTLDNLRTMCKICNAAFGMLLSKQLSLKNVKNNIDTDSDFIINNE